MKRSRWWSLALVLIAAAPAGAQSGHDHGHGGGAEPHRRVEACQREFDQVVSDGRGAGLAFAADQNGYPGPLHVLELKDRLHLTPEQETRTRQTAGGHVRRRAAARGRLAAAEARLQQIFADKTADAETVRAAVADAERARAEVRLAHLLTHLRTHDLLTENQRQTYQRLRWGARGISNACGGPQLPSTVGRTRASGAPRERSPQRPPLAEPPLTALRPAEAGTRAEPAPPGPRG
jgi:hypothetical protein